MSYLQKYVRQVKPRNESYIPHVEKIQSFLTEASSTEESTKMENVIVACWNNRNQTKSKFATVIIKDKDVKNWYKQNGGLVISAAINRHVYVFLKENTQFNSNELNHRIIWRQIEIQKNYKNIINPIVRSVFKLRKLKSFYECYYSGDFPSMSGSGSSSAFATSLLYAESLLNKKKISKKKIFEDAIHIERVMMKEHGGIQDQVRSSIGGLGLIKISKNGNITNKPIDLSKHNMDTLQNSIEIYFYQGSRLSSRLMKHHIENLKENQMILNEMMMLTKEAHSLLISNKPNFIKDFANLIKESWLIKKKFHNQISSPDLDRVIKKGLDLGAYAGKIMGAGSSGFLFFIKEPGNKLNLNNYSKKLSQPIDIKFDFDGVKQVNRF